MNPEQIKKMRNQAGLSVNEAARQVHIAARTWARYESGDRSIPDAIVHLFCLLNKIELKNYM